MALDYHRFPKPEYEDSQEEYEEKREYGQHSHEGSRRCGFAGTLDCWECHGHLAGKLTGTHSTKQVSGSGEDTALYPYPNASRLCPTSSRAGRKGCELERAGGPPARIRPPRAIRRAAPGQSGERLTG